MLPSTAKGSVNGSVRLPNASSQFEERHACDVSALKLDQVEGKIDKRSAVAVGG
jgi:hypothetical protein